MNDKLPYCILTASTIEYLEGSVNYACEVGYEPIGGVLQTANGDFCQTVWRRPGGRGENPDGVLTGSRLKEIAAGGTRPMKAKVVMKRLGYADPKSFWAAVRREGIPHTKLSLRNFVFYENSLNEWIERRSANHAPGS